MPASPAQWTPTESGWVLTTLVSTSSKGVTSRSTSKDELSADVGGHLLAPTTQDAPMRNALRRDHEPGACSTRRNGSSRRGAPVNMITRIGGREASTIGRR